LTKEDGTTIEFVAAKQSNQASTVNQAKITALDEIRVVAEQWYLRYIVPALSPGDRCDGLGPMDVRGLF
jgi:hypothetical protein